MFKFQARSFLYTKLKFYFHLILYLIFFDTKTNYKKQLEEIFSKSTKKYALSVSMARVGLYLLLKTRIKKNQLVLMSPYIISEIVSMVVLAGGVPYFVDIKKNSFNIDEKKLIGLIKNKKNIGAVILTHYYGELCDTRLVSKHTKEKNIFLIEDCAQAIGAKYNKKNVGYYSNASIFSFGLIKPATSFLGGLIISDSKIQIEKIQNEIKNWPLTSKKFLLKKIITGVTFDTATNKFIFNLLTLRLFKFFKKHKIKFFENKLDIEKNPKILNSLPSIYKTNITNIQAKIIIQNLSYVNSDLRQRKNNAKIYEKNLNNLLITKVNAKNTNNIYLYYPVMIKNRETIVNDLVKNNIDIQISHHRDCSSMKCFKKYYNNCPNSKQAERETIYLPVYPGFLKRNIHIICNKLNKYKL